MREELERFVASLAIPADRRAIVLDELVDHVACATEAATREGRDPDAAARAALGNLEALRRSLEAVEPAFRITRSRALGHGLAASVVIAILLDQGGPAVTGVLGALVVIAIGAVMAPPRVLDLLRAELRAPRIRGAVSRGIAIGPALTYALTVTIVPFVIWIGLIIGRAIAGDTALEVPWSAYAIAIAVHLTLLVEAMRARRATA